MEALRVPVAVDSRLTVREAVVEPDGDRHDRGCLGQLPEILDGDAPHHPRGCDAQAWSVSEALRVWKLLETANHNGKN